jgi:hypothetical protein
VTLSLILAWNLDVEAGKSMAVSILEEARAKIVDLLISMPFLVFTA